MRYLITWKIDVEDADNPTEAAMAALLAQVGTWERVAERISDGSGAVVFNVKNVDSGEEVVVDLSDDARDVEEVSDDEER